MANMMDYMRWRGDLTFSAVPFCEVDNLIFSKLTFLNLQQILPPYGSGASMTVGEAARLYREAQGDTPPSLGLLVPKEIPDMFMQMALCDRYRHLLLSDYVNHIDTEQQLQFAALTIFLSPDEMYISFCGTDDTLIGWKENFNMSHTDVVPAQREAVDYVNAVMARTAHRRVYIGGHSKGGNLAIYSAMHCDAAYRDRIVRIYNNDGPGFRKEVVESNAYRAVQDRICTLIPQNAVVGRLLEHDERYRVVHSSATGLWQHNGFSWEVLGKSFVSEPELTKESRMIEQSVKSWIASMTEEQRQAFVDALYRFLTATNAATLTELTADRTWLLRLMKASDPESKKIIFNGLAQLTGEAGRLWAETILPALRAKGIGMMSKEAKESKDAKNAPGAPSAPATLPPKTPPTQS